MEKVLQPLDKTHFPVANVVLVVLYILHFSIKEKNFTKAKDLKFLQIIKSGIIDMLINFELVKRYWNILEVYEKSLTKFHNFIIG